MLLLAEQQPRSRWLHAWCSLVHCYGCAGVWVRVCSTRDALAAPAACRGISNCCTACTGTRLLMQPAFPRCFQMDVRQGLLEGARMLVAAFKGGRQCHRQHKLCATARLCDLRSEPRCILSKPSRHHHAQTVQELSIIHSDIALLYTRISSEPAQNVRQLVPFPSREP